MWSEVLEYGKLIPRPPARGSTGPMDRSRRQLGYHRAMARTQTMVQLNERLVRVLDDIAHRRNLSRSALIREIIDNYLATAEELKIGAQIAAGYQKIPPVTPDEWGDLAAFTDLATADLLHRLDAEERRQGNDPW